MNRKLHIETVYRSVLKSLTYRIIAGITTSLIAWGITGRFQIAVAIGLGDAVIKIGVFYLHERIWNRVNLGRAAADLDYEI